MYSKIDEQCRVTDLHGRHCPDTPVHRISHNGCTVSLCDRCYVNVIAGAYERRGDDTEFSETV